MRIIFAGTPDFAVPCLQKLIDANHTISAVYTQPDRPAGRGRHLTASPVKQLAVTAQIPVFQPITLRDSAVQAAILAENPDVIVVVAYGLLFPVAILKIPKFACINVHASLLPRWRGAAPIQQSILSGDASTGVTIMHMTKKLDAGDMLSKTECLIAADDTAESLHKKLALSGADLLVETLDRLSEITPIKQNEDNVTYTGKIQKHDACIDWGKPAITIERMIRAYQPWPVAFTTYQNAPLRIWGAVIQPPSKNTKTLPPGTLLQATPEGIDIQTGDGILRLLKLQLPGGKVLSAAQFYQSQQHHLHPGKHLLDI